MKQVFTLVRHATVDTYLYDGQFEKREVLTNPDLAEVTNMKKQPLLDFGLDALKGSRILSGLLKVKMITPDYPYTVAVSTVTAQWDPKVANNYEATEGTPWAGSLWMSDVIMGCGHSIHHFADTAYDPDTCVLSVPIQGELLTQVANGLSFGFTLIDSRSRSYGSLPGEGWDVVKKFAITGDIVPTLEVEYEPLPAVTPDPVADFTALAIQTPESFTFADAALSFSVPQVDGFCCYRLYQAEACGVDSLPLCEMTQVSPALVPQYDKTRLTHGMRLSGLKPATSYLFALVTDTGVCQSAPCYARVTTTAAPSSIAPSYPAFSPEGMGCRPEKVLSCASLEVTLLDEITKVNPQTGEPHLYDTSVPYYYNNAVCTAAAPGEHFAFQLSCKRLTDKVSLKVSLEGEDAAAARLYRIWYLPVKEAWYPEVAIDTDGVLSLPAADQEIPGQVSQAVLCDITVPAQKKGKLSFNVVIEANDETVKVPVCLDVADFALQKTDFRVELNGYVSLPECAGLTLDDPNYLEVEREYYRLAHENDMVPNILPYFHTGIVQETFAPEVAMVDGEMHVVDWTRWDEHFAPYLDGSYLAKSEGRWQPLTHIYLPIHENWPMKVDDYHLVKTDDLSPDTYPENINTHKIRSSSPEADFDPAYRAGIKSVLCDFIRHIDEKGWTNVEFQYFFNNKHFYKKRGLIDFFDGRAGLEVWLTGPTTGAGAGNGCSWWLLDEPHFIDDFRMLQFYASILPEARAETGSGKNVVFRADLSAYNQKFDFFDGMLDVAVAGGTLYNASSSYFITERKKTFGESVWTYGGWNSVNRDALDNTLWLLDAYLKGGEGMIPWYNYAIDCNFEEADDCAAIYPGTRFGSLRPFASMRLKAGRKAVVLMHYLTTLQKRFNYSYAQLTEYVSHFVSLRNNVNRTDFLDAGVVRFEGNNSYASLEALRLDILRKLSGAK